MPRKKPEKTPHSCADCRHQLRLSKDGGECRLEPMKYIPELDIWASPPAPDNFLCGQHLIRCNS